MTPYCRQKVGLSWIVGIFLSAKAPSSMSPMPTTTPVPSTNLPVASESSYATAACNRRCGLTGGTITQPEENVVSPDTRLIPYGTTCSELQTFVSRNVSEVHCNLISRFAFDPCGCTTVPTASPTGAPFVASNPDGGDSSSPQGDSGPSPADASASSVRYNPSTGALRLLIFLVTVTCYI